MKKITAILTKKDEHSVSDWNLDAWYQGVLAGDGTVYFSNILMLNELRLGVRLGEIEPFSFEFEGNTINIYYTGELSKWYNGLGDHNIIQMEAMTENISRDQAKKQCYEEFDRLQETR